MILLQNDYLTRKIKKEMGHIDWNRMSAIQVYRIWQALTGHSSVFSSFNGIRIHLVNLQLHDISIPIHMKQQLRDQQPGAFLFDPHADILWIKCGSQSPALSSIIGCKSVQPQYKRPLTATEFANGYLKPCHKSPDMHFT